MNKILTISIAAYNVENYLRNTLESLIIKNLDLLEVLIVNDGSKDNTLKIAEEYEQKYPNTFKIINKKNGGYGSTINYGIKNATGKYFKQLDGDDTFDTNNLNNLCIKLKNITTDVIYTPYIEHNIKTNTFNTIRNDIEKHDDLNNIEDVIKYSNKFLYMHNLMYKTELLKNNEITLDEHCFYTDTEYVLFPMMFCKSITILEEPIYIYRCGDVNQSVGKKGKLKHYKDHIKMSDTLLSKVSKIKKLSSNLSDYLLEYIASILASEFGNYLMLLRPTTKNFKYILNRDKNIIEADEEIYNKMKKYSKCINTIRKRNYILYVCLYYYKILKERNV